MTDPGTIVITGATGTVGGRLAAGLAAAWPGRLCAVGRACPPGWRPGDSFTECDLADPDATARAAARLAAGPPVAGLVCAAGLDSRAGLRDFGPAAAACMQVSCLAHVRLLHAALTAWPPGSAAFRAVVISSDVVGDRQPGTAAYAAAKAATDEAFRHATCDAPEPGLALLLVRLPYIGVPMAAAAPGPAPPPRTPAMRPLPVLEDAAAAVIRFAVAARPACVEVWDEA